MQFKLGTQIIYAYEKSKLQSSLYQNFRIFIAFNKMLTKMDENFILR